MATPDLHITTQRFLRFIELKTKSGDELYVFAKEACSRIGFAYNNFSNLKAGSTSLTLKHIEALAREYNLDINWLFGLSNKMYRAAQKVDQMEVLKQAMTIIDDHVTRITTPKKPKKATKQKSAKK